MVKTASKKSTSKKSSLTMGDLLEKYGGQVKALQRGQKLTGKVIDKTSKRLVMDINKKSEGLVAEKAFTEAKDYIRTLTIGDNITASVIIPETPEGYTILSLRGAQEEASWKKIEKAQKEDLPLVVLGKSAASSGVLVEIDGLTGFIPNSQLGKAISKNPKDLINEHFKVKILEINRRTNKIVLSEKEVSDAEDIKMAKMALKKIKVGEVYDGVVTNVMNFGCFVALQALLGKDKKVSVEGLVHISEISWDKVDNISLVCGEGKSVKVKVIGVEGNKLSLSIKQAQDDPWLEADKRYKVDSKHAGKVVKLSDFGVFVALEPGIEGLIHMTKIPPGNKLDKGQEVNVYVEEINSKAKKLSLGLVLTTKPVGYK